MLFVCFLAQQLFFALLIKQQPDSRPFLGSAEAVFRTAASLLLRFTSGDHTAVGDLQPRLVASVREGLPKFHKSGSKTFRQIFIALCWLVVGGGGEGGITVTPISRLHCFHGAIQLLFGL